MVVSSPAFRLPSTGHMWLAQAHHHMFSQPMSPPRLAQTVATDGSVATWPPRWVLYTPGTPSGTVHTSVHPGYTTPHARYRTPLYRTLYAVHTPRPAERKRVLATFGTCEHPCVIPYLRPSVRASIRGTPVQEPGYVTVLTGRTPVVHRGTLVITVHNGQNGTNP